MARALEAWLGLRAEGYGTMTMDARHNVVFQVVVLGISSVLVEFAILFAYGELAGRAAAAAQNPRFEKITNWVAGSLLIGAGVGLARLRRT